MSSGFSEEVYESLVGETKGGPLVAVGLTVKPGIGWVGEGRDSSDSENSEFG